MSRRLNFNPGPSTLPLPVLEQIRQEIVDYRNMGISIIEASHRSQEYDQIHTEAIILIKEILELPDNYKVLFLGGGATLQFSMVPMNLLCESKGCDFTLTGSWSKKAYADAAKIGKVNVIFDGSTENFTKLPAPSSLSIDPDAAYVHLTSNETIHGIQWNQWPEVNKVPLVADMSSDILSRPLPVEKFGLIYAGAQKNMGPAGATLVIIREDILDAVANNLTAYLSYKTHADKNSLYNTPPVFSIYVIKLVLEWVKANGGMAGAKERAESRSSAIYSVIDSNAAFFRCPVAKNYRSKMNIVFRLPSEALEKRFIEKAGVEGIIGLKGHSSVGGCRASIYNCMPVEGALALAAFMNHFITKFG